MKKTKTTCDYCERDISTTDSSVHGYRLVLTSEAMPASRPGPGGGRPAVMVHNPMPDSKDFCNTACLKRWLEQF